MLWLPQPFPELSVLWGLVVLPSGQSHPSSGLCGGSSGPFHVPQGGKSLWGTMGKQMQAAAWGRAHHSRGGGSIQDSPASCKENQYRTGSPGEAKLPFQKGLPHWVQLQQQECLGEAVSPMRGEQQCFPLLAGGNELGFEKSPACSPHCVFPAQRQDLHWEGGIEPVREVKMAFRKAHEQQLCVLLPLVLAPGQAAMASTGPWLQTSLHKGQSLPWGAEGWVCRHLAPHCLQSTF